MNSSRPLNANVSNMRRTFPNAAPVAAQTYSAPAPVPQYSVGASSGLGSRLFQSVRNASATLGTTIPVLVTLALLLITGIIIYLVIKIRGYSFKTVDLMRTAVINANPMAGEHMTFLGSGIPALKNGSEYTFSLWVYVESITITSDYKVILYQGNASSYVNGSTFVYMDPNTNKLYITLRTNGKPDTPNANNMVNLQQIKDNDGLMHAVVDYVPLQRWVHIAVAVRDAVMYMYLDGELYSVQSTYDMALRADGTRPMITRPIGDVFVGGKADREGINGYIGRAQFMNFAVSLKDAKRIYGEGPYKQTLLSYIGINNVAIRNPFFYTDPDLEATANTCATPTTDNLKPPKY